MNRTCIDHIWPLDVDTDAKLALLALAWGADEAGLCISEVAVYMLKQCGMAPYERSRMVSRLIDHGYIEIVKEAGPDNAHRFDIRLTLPGIRQEGGAR